MDTPSQKICVCGAGTMGSAIAQAFAQHDFEVILFDVDQNTISVAKERIIMAIESLVLKKKIDAGNYIIKKIRFTSSVAECKAHVIIEAIIENLEAKALLLNQLADINASSTIFATNTSSLSVTQIADRFSRPGQLAGMHFFNPATVMKLVEVVITEHSTPHTVDVITSLAGSIGKTPVVCRDSPGFIVNRVARPYYLEALYLCEKYHADVGLIDALMENSGFKMGPFKLMDLIGNDINYAVSCIVYDALGKPERLRPSSIQKEKVDSGQLGRKTGRGYYEYNP